MAYRETRRKYLIRAGFLPAESRELAHTSTAGMYAPYFQVMVRGRRSLKMLSKRYKWSDNRYRSEVRKRYVAKDILVEGEQWNKNLVWALLRWYQDFFPVPDEYESPWKKRTGRKQKARRQQKRTTRSQMLRDWIADLNRSIERARSEPRRQKLQAQKEQMESQLSRLQ